MCSPAAALWSKLRKTKAIFLFLDLTHCLSFIKTDFVYRNDAKTVNEVVKCLNCTLIKGIMSLRLSGYIYVYIFLYYMQLLGSRRKSK